MRVAWSPDLSYRAVAPEVRANTEHAVSVLEKLGCRVERVDPGWSEEIDRIASDWYRSAEMGRMLLAADQGSSRSRLPGSCNDWAAAGANEIRGSPMCLS